MKGKGLQQTAKARESRKQVLSFFKDDKWHRYSEIYAHGCKISAATLSKELKALTKMKLLEKKIDIESGEYPYPVSYRIGERAKFLVEIAVKIYHAHNELSEFLEKTEDKKEYLEAMTEFFHDGCESILEVKNRHKELKPQDIEWMIIPFFMQPLESIVSDFIERF